MLQAEDHANGAFKKCQLAALSLPTGETRPLFFIWERKSVPCLLPKRISLGHQILALTSFKTSYDSTNPSSLDRQSLLLNSKFLKPKMMSCSFERLQFLECYQEKKVIFLEFSAPSRCPEKGAVSQSSPGDIACRKTLLLTPNFLHILKPWKL